MIGALVIVFREVLEAALVIGVVAAAVKGLPHRGRRIALGIALGVLGAVVVAAGLGTLASLVQGQGQELFQVVILLAAGLMLAWHNIYMARHGRALSEQLRTLGHEVVTGAASATMLVGVTAIAILREGSEVVLFLYGLAAGDSSRWTLLAGSALGLSAGVLVGWILFAGLSRIPLRRLFQVSGLAILFIAAGMLAHAAQYLVQMGWLPALAPQVWDTSSLVTGKSIVGRSLEALAGYTPTPSLMQVLVWLAAFAAIAWMMRRQSRDTRTMTAATA